MVIERAVMNAEGARTKK